MDETTYLRILQDDPDNERIRSEYFAWLVETDDHRAKYVQLMKDRLDLQAKLMKVDWDILCFAGVQEEWLEVVFPLRVRSETVGRVYLRPNPASPPFVEIGKPVVPDTVVCIIEVLGTLNEVAAGVHGVVGQVEVADGDSVEFDQVLFRLKRPSDPLVSWSRKS